MNNRAKSGIQKKINQKKKFKIKNETNKKFAKFNVLKFTI